MSPLTEPTKLTLAKSFTWNETVWNPSMIQTALWLDAADASTVTQSGGLISQVNDKSGNSRNFTSSSGARPTLTGNGLNSKNVMTFGGSQYLTSINTASTWNFLHNSIGGSFFGVYKAGDNSNPNALYSIAGNSAVSSTSTGFHISYDDRPSVTRSNNMIATVYRGVLGEFVSNNIIGDNNHPVNEPVITAWTCNNTSSTPALRSLVYINGGIAYANNLDTGAASSGNATYALQVGAAGNNAITFVGYIAEIIIVSGIVSASTCQAVEGYLAHKWGLTANLPSNHPYKTVGPTP